MFRIENILVPVDFSERSIAAARHAAALARRFDARITLLHVIVPPPPEYAGFEGGYDPPLVRPSREEVIEHFRRQMECVVLKAGVDRPVEKIVVEGDPARQIEKIAGETHTSLIVMPTHGYGTFRRFILGSVTAKVLRDLACPVLTGAHVPEPPAGDPQPYHRVACAVELTPHSEKVLAWASGFAAAYGARLAVLHAAPSLEVSGRSGQYLGSEWRGAMLQAARGEVEKLAARLGASPEIFAGSATVSEFVPAAVRQFGADLLVIGRSMQGGLLGRLRTNAYALIRESPCPVASV
jgi:nucleotide-binding universal stress UspA family protein